jgi:hypothetical protein
MKSYLSWGSSTHVVSSTATVEKFVMEFNEEGKTQHLCLACCGNGIPSLKPLGRKGRKGGSVGDVTWEGESGSNSPPSTESSHGNTSVLDLRVTEPGEGLIRTKLSKAKGVPNFSELNSVGLLHDVGLGGTKGDCPRAGLNRGESRSRSHGGDEGDDSSGLHGDTIAWPIAELIMGGSVKVDENTHFREI